MSPDLKKLIGEMKQVQVTTIEGTSVCDKCLFYVWYRHWICGVERWLLFTWVNRWSFRNRKFHCGSIKAEEGK